MAALLEFVPVRDQQRLAAALIPAPRLAVRWLLDQRGRPVCAWERAQPWHRGADNPLLAQPPNATAELRVA